MLRKIYVGNGVVHHASDFLGWHWVGTSSGRVAVSRPPGEVVEVFPLRSFIDLEFHERRTVGREDDVKQPRAVRTDLYNSRVFVFSLFLLVTYQE